jgi:hypothetical protein
MAKVIKETANNLDTNYNWYQICNELGISGVNREVIKMKFINKVDTLYNWRVCLIQEKLLK